MGCPGTRFGSGKPRELRPCRNAGAGAGAVDGCCALATAGACRATIKENEAAQARQTLIEFSVIETPLWINAARHTPRAAISLRLKPNPAGDPHLLPSESLSRMPCAYCVPLWAPIVAIVPYQRHLSGAVEGSSVFWAERRARRVILSAP